MAFKRRTEQGRGRDCEKRRVLLKRRHTAEEFRIALVIKAKYEEKDAAILLGKN